MRELTNLERDIVKFILEQDEDGRKFLNQIKNLRVESVNHNGYAAMVIFDADDDFHADPYYRMHPRIRIRTKTSGVCGAILYLYQGRINSLEIYSYDDQYLNLDEKDYKIDPPEDDR